MQTVKLFKRTAALFAAIAVAAVSAAVAAFADGAPLGSGTEADPYIVKSGAELAAIGGSENGVGYITLANDIDLSAYQGQTCIIKKLTGKLDGAGHKITGLSLKGGKGTWAATILTGLIGELSGNVENLTISNAVITGAEQYNFVGVLAAYIPEGSTVEMKNCTVTGEIKEEASSSAAYLGTYVGTAQGSIDHNTTVRIDSCISNVNVDCSTAKNVGGVVGQALYYVNLTVCKCAVLGDISATQYIGGILGFYTGDLNITLADSYFGGKLKGRNQFGIAYSYAAPAAVACSNVYYDSDKNGTLKMLNKTGNKESIEAALEQIKGVTTAEIMALASTLDGFEASGEFGGYPVPKQQTAAAFSVTVDESNVNVTAAKAGSYSLVLASYFGDALADVKIQTVTFTNDGDGQTVSVPDGFTADGRTFRAMLWSGMCPLAKSNN
mgnify:CR=1 FL=1